MARILVIDDEQYIRTALREVLEAGRWTLAAPSKEPESRIVPQPEVPFIPRSHSLGRLTPRYESWELSTPTNRGRS